ncbi:MAG: hypothetical protein K6C05_01720 [Anaerovibrio sp.]|uniref:hypothetical protein n=1 Tax=Anaerovibrio sp. TaxID=1872532 RepID=UPI0025E9DB9D|nr:hypothetical protein [Anaerovibrio sp.]MCR5175548.1 hypothetical protein [Anaerovibrio sp.]
MADTSVNYKCPSCGAPLAYTPGKGNQIKCEYCEKAFTAEELEQFYAAKESSAAEAQKAKDSKIEKKEYEMEAAGGAWDAEEIAILKAMTCSSCGAEIVCDNNTLATECVYCGNPVMVPGRYESQLRPDMVIPFQTTKEDAKKAFAEYHKGKWLLPGNFASNARVEAIQGMYVPYWLFDENIEAAGEFSATKTRYYTDGDYDVTETDHYRILRNGRMSFHNVPVDGSAKMDNKWMESIEPFDYSNMVPFTTTYMAGFLADRYDVTASEALPDAEIRIRESADGVLSDSVEGYSSCTTDALNVVCTNGKQQYAMAPIWILSTKYQDKPYTFIMNGQTGKLVGELPVDENKAKMYWGLAGLITLPITYYICKWLVILLESIFED